ncbi:MAG: hypothetical protein LBQ27_03205 [Clostridiales bacterium]|jgi:hypothetical protein|nr:hypothetical protein [Clostridiales bacterium]
MNEDEILAQQVLADDPKGAKKAAKLSVKKTKKNKNSTAEYDSFSNPAAPVYNKKRARADQARATQMMHVPPQPAPMGQDDEVYNLVKGEGGGFDGKKTYYEPFSRIMLKTVCIILIPLLLVLGIASYTKENYYPTCGSFNIEIYHANGTTDRGTYFISARDTKRFEIRRETIYTEDKNGNVTAETFEGYRLSDLISVSQFESKEKKYDYFVFNGWYIDESGAHHEGDSTAYAPRLDEYMIFVFKIDKGKKVEVDGKAIPEGKQPSSWMITEPKSMLRSDRIYGVQEIKFGVKAIG